MPEFPEEVRARYERALQAVVDHAREDPYVLAVIVLGSLSYDVVWERSDIDLWIVLQEGRHKKSQVTLTEEDVNIHASLFTRGQFKRLMEGALQSGFVHSAMSKGAVVFSRDETINALYADLFKVGEADRSRALLTRCGDLSWSLVKAQKWLSVKQDRDYCFFWIMKGIDSLAAIEVIWNYEIPGREAIHQALKLNPALFQQVYTELINGEKTAERLQAALNSINGYLLERAQVLFAPVLEYLAASDGPRSGGEIDDHFVNNGGIWVAGACEWLADHALIQRLGAPVRLTERSRADFQEVAYYYDGTGGVQ